MTAEVWRALIEKAVSTLESLPEIGAPVEELGWPGVREQIVGNYRVLYHFDGTTCRIGPIIRAERNLKRAVAPDDFDPPSPPGRPSA